MSQVELQWPSKGEGKVPEASSEVILPKGNLLLQGDCRSWLPALPASVQTVYIDPPFNTGGKFNNYDDNQNRWEWLTLLHQHLKQLHGVLLPSGSLFLHLDDNAVDHARLLLDEVFGPGNFVSRITVDARSPSAFSTVNAGVFKASEYILWYARDKKKLKQNPLRTPREPDRAYYKFLQNPEDPPHQWIFSTVRKVCPKGSDINRFIVENASQVFRLAPVSSKKAGKEIVLLKERSQQEPSQAFHLVRPEPLADVYVLNGQQILFYDRQVSRIDGKLTASRPLTNIWTDIAWEGIAKEGGVRFKQGKKPERLIRRILQLSTEPGDLVLDSFAGSGTTPAVAHKMGRHWIAIEKGPQAATHIQPRLQSLIEGQDSTGITKLENWQGGGSFTFLQETSEC